MGVAQQFRFFVREMLHVRFGPLILVLLLFLIPIPHEIHAWYIEEEGILGTEPVLVGKIVVSHAVTFLFNLVAWTPAAPLWHLALWGVLLPLLLYAVTTLAWTLITRRFPALAHPFLNKPRITLPASKRTIMTNIALFLAVMSIILLVTEGMLAWGYPQKDTRLQLPAENDKKNICWYPPDFSYRENKGKEFSVKLRNYVIGNPYTVKFDEGTEQKMKLNSSAGIYNIPNCNFTKVSEDGTRLITYHTNNYGFRMNENISLKKLEKKKRVLVLGDSFAFGVGIGQNETISYLLQELLGNTTEVLNGAIQGLSSLQSYGLYYNEYAALDADLVVFFHYMNDITGNVEPRTDYDRPVYDPVKGSVVVTGRPLIVKNAFAADHSSTSRFLHISGLIDKNRDLFLNRRRVMSEEASDIDVLQTYKKEASPRMQIAVAFNCEMVLGSFGRLSEQRNQTFLMVYIPAHIELDEPYFRRTMTSYKNVSADDFDLKHVRNAVAECAKEQNLRYIDLTSFFVEHTEKKPLEWYNAPGSHWSPKATNLTAHIVYDWIKQKGVI